MIRLLLLVVIAYLVWLGIESLLGRLRAAAGFTARPLRPPGTPPGPAPAPSDSVETLVRCAGCGIHVIRSRALTVGGRAFCSEECRRRAAQSA
jgi:uncharacterized protein